MKRFIPPSVPFTEKWSIEMKKVLSVVSLIMGIVPFSLLFIWKQEFMRQSPVNYIVIGGVVIVIGAGFVIALYQFKSRHFRDLLWWVLIRFVVWQGFVRVNLMERLRIIRKR